MDNAGGGLGLGVWTFPSSAQALKATMQARTSKQRTVAANRRWGQTNVSGGQAIYDTDMLEAIATEPDIDGAYQRTNISSYY